MLYPKRQTPQHLDVSRVQRQSNLSALASVHQLDDALRHLRRSNEGPEESARCVHVLEHLRAHLTRLDQYSFDVLGAGDLCKFSAQRMVQSEKCSFRSAVCGEVCGTQVAEDGGDGDDGAALF